MWSRLRVWSWVWLGAHNPNLLVTKHPLHFVLANQCFTLFSMDTNTESAHTCTYTHTYMHARTLTREHTHTYILPGLADPSKVAACLSKAVPCSFIARILKIYAWPGDSSVKVYRLEGVVPRRASFTNTSYPVIPSLSLISVGTGSLHVRVTVVGVDDSKATF